MFNIGSQELVVILFVVLMLFGAKRIPEVAKSVGTGMREFRRAMKGIEDELRFDDDRRPIARPAPRRADAQSLPVVQEQNAVGSAGGTVSSTSPPAPRSVRDEGEDAPAPDRPSEGSAP